MPIRPKPVLQKESHIPLSMFCSLIFCAGLWQVFISHCSALTTLKTLKTKNQLIEDKYHTQWEYTLPHPPARSVQAQALAQTGLRHVSLKCDVPAAAWVNRQRFSSHSRTHKAALMMHLSTVGSVFATNISKAREAKKALIFLEKTAAL